ncbi:MAG: aldo/keto reductase [Candidatus Poribacteria bacterium]|nr:aldo/keto reductase [Candidatus Poribacteria bacterium]
MKKSSGNSPTSSASSITFPKMGIGCWSYGGGDYWGDQAQSDVDAVANTALDAGIVFFDTAVGYNEGRSEQSLGIALKHRRQEALIGTKTGDPNPATLPDQLEGSLRRLQTDYIDLYMIHWPNPKYPVGEVFDALSRLKTEGKIRAIGVCNFGCQQLSETLAIGAQIETNQLCYNLLSRAIELEIVPLCQQHQIGILAYMPLLQGILADRFKTLEEIPPQQSRFRHFRPDREMSRHDEAGAEAELWQTLEQIRQICREKDLPMSRLAIAWVMAKTAVSCVLVGTRNTAELAQNLEAVNYAMPADLVKKLDQLTLPLLHRLGGNADYFWATRTK